MDITYAGTPGGKVARYFSRPEYNDEVLIFGILGSDEYHLRELTDLEGWALDIGAHVGTVGIALAVDHPRLNVVMVEPVPDNARLIRESIVLNGVGDRCYVVEAMASGYLGTATCRWNYRDVHGQDRGYVIGNAMVGNIWRLTDGENVESEQAEIRTTTVSELSEMANRPWTFAKLDCEGCEWDFLQGVDPAMLPYIVMEVHDSPPADIALILPGYDIEVLADNGGSGIVRATAK